MITPTSSDAKELIDLAERMGIPTEDAVRRVLKHFTEKQVSEGEDAVAAVPAVPVDG